MKLGVDVFTFEVQGVAAREDILFIETKLTYQRYMPDLGEFHDETLEDFEIVDEIEVEQFRMKQDRELSCFRL